MSGFTSITPYTDAGSLMGGVREQRAVLNNIQADAFRSAAQAQNITQRAEANSGADVDNDQEQDVTLNQTADAMTERMVTINAVTGTNANADSFNSNYLQQYLAGADASDYLARATSNIAQQQGGDQDAYSELVDFAGTGSDAYNVYDQRGDVSHTFDVDLSATVVNTTVADSVANAFNQARFRKISAQLMNQNAEAIFTSGQSQGTLDSPVTQDSTANAGTADNDLEQGLGIQLTGPAANHVDLVASLDLSRVESASLSPRTTSLIVGENAAGGSSGAINTYAASQEQAHAQTARGGVDRFGNVTENGGRSGNNVGIIALNGAAAGNAGSAAITNTESTEVNNSISITI